MPELMFAVVGDTIKGPAEPEAELPERPCCDAWTPDSCYTAPNRPAAFVFSFGEVPREACFHSLVAAAKYLYAGAFRAGRRSENDRIWARLEELR